MDCCTNGNVNPPSRVPNRKSESDWPSWSLRAVQASSNDRKRSISTPHSLYPHTLCAYTLVYVQQKRKIASNRAERIYGKFTFLIWQRRNCTFWADVCLANNTHCCCQQPKLFYAANVPHVVKIVSGIIRKSLSGPVWLHRRRLNSVTIFFYILSAAMLSSLLFSAYQ